jgi:hypothetical protein
MSSFATPKYLSVQHSGKPSKAVSAKQQYLTHTRQSKSPLMSSRRPNTGYPSSGFVPPFNNNNYQSDQKMNTTRIFDYQNNKKHMGQREFVEALYGSQQLGK